MPVPTTLRMCRSEPKLLRGFNFMTAVHNMPATTGYALRRDRWFPGQYIYRIKNPPELESELEYEWYIHTPRAPEGDVPWTAAHNKTSDIFEGADWAVYRIL